MRIYTLLKTAFTILLASALLGCTKVSESPNVTIAEIKANPSEFVGKKVTINGTYMGWQSKESPPVTRSDWVVDDGTGRIYVTGCNPGLDPVKDVGKNVTVVGYVRLAGERPYIEAVKCEVRL